MKKIRLDIFQLCDDADKGQGILKAIPNAQSEKIIKSIIEEIKLHENFTSKQLAKLLGFVYIDFYNSIYRNRISLYTLTKLVNLWSNITNKSSNEALRKLSECIEYLTYGAGNTHKIVRCPKFLTEEMCKIAGAIIADGHLGKQISKTNNRLRNCITIDEQHKDSIILFSKWVYNQFGLSLKYKYDIKNNYWRIDFCDKVVYRYLNKIFGIPAGNKAAIVKIPEIIYEAGNIYRLSFAKGVMLFDGGVGFRRPYFNIQTKSPHLKDNLIAILRENNIKPDYINDYRKITGTFEIRICNKTKLKLLLRLFSENDTKKWKQLYVGLYGFQIKNKEYNDIVEELNILFPRTRQALTYIDILCVIHRMSKLNLIEISNILLCNPKTLSEYVYNLENWGVLCSKREGIYKYWSINPQLKIERR